MYGINPDEQGEHPMSDTTVAEIDRRLELTGEILRAAELSLAMAWEAALMAVVDRDGALLGAVNSEIQACIQRRDGLALEFLELTKQRRLEWEATRGEV